MYVHDHVCSQITLWFCWKLHPQIYSQACSCACSLCMLTNSLPGAIDGTLPAYLMVCTFLNTADSPMYKFKYISKCTLENTLKYTLHYTLKYTYNNAFNQVPPCTELNTPIQLACMFTSNLTRLSEEHFWVFTNIHLWVTLKYTPRSAFIYTPEYALKYVPSCTLQHTPNLLGSMLLIILSRCQTLQISLDYILWFRFIFTGS